MTARHALSCAEAATICADLERFQHLHVLIEVDAAEVVHLWPQRTVTTTEEVGVLALVLSTTDARCCWHAWHGPVKL